MPATPSAPGRAAIIVNPTKVRDAAVREQVNEAFRDAGCGDPRWYETTEADPGFGQTKQALTDGASLVCALGGDGTVRVVGSALVGTGVPLGILPGGTGNLLARQLDLPVDDLDETLAVALGGRNRSIDVGSMTLFRTDGSREQHHFLVMAGVGFDAKMVSEAPEELKKRLGWMAYMFSAAKNIPGRRVKARLSYDGAGFVTRRMRTVIVGNCGRLQGGVELAPDAQIDDGLLDVVVASPRGLVGWAGLTLRVLTKSNKGHPMMTRTQVEHVTVSVEDPIPVELDGDPMGQVVGFATQVEQHALRVCVA